MTSFKNISKINKLPNYFFIFFLIISLILFSYIIWKIFNPSNIHGATYYIFYLSFFFIAILFFLIGTFYFDDSKKLNISLVLISSLVTIYLSELIVSTFNQYSINIELRDNKLKELEYVNFIEDLRNRGFDAYPNFYPMMAASTNGLLINEKKIYPLSGISNSFTSFHSENGYNPIIKTDKHGFNNDPDIYNNPLDIALIGDSFVEGWSVNQNENISHYLNELGWNTINLGKGSIGPLTELATLIEYAKPYEPKIVIWFYCFNDISNLNTSKNTILKKYLDHGDYSNNLIDRQSEIDESIKAFIKLHSEKKDSIIAPKGDRLSFSEIKNFLKLTGIRSLIEPNIQEKPYDIDLFKRILLKANLEIEKWGGKMYFVYLPNYLNYSQKKKHKFKNEVIRTVEDLGIPLIDLHEKAFKLHSDPLSLFPFRKNGHFNKYGYQLVAETINKLIEYP